MRHRFFVNKVICLVQRVEELVDLAHPLVQEPVRAPRLGLEVHYTARSVNLGAHLLGRHQIACVCLIRREAEELAQPLQRDARVVLSDDEQVVLDDALPEVLLALFSVIATEDVCLRRHLAAEGGGEGVPMDDLLRGELLHELLVQGQIRELRILGDLMQ